MKTAPTEEYLREKEVKDCQSALVLAIRREACHEAVKVCRALGPKFYHADMHEAADACASAILEHFGEPIPQEIAT